VALRAGVAQSGLERGVATSQWTPQPKPAYLRRLTAGAEQAAMSNRQPPGRRADYRWFHAITTRWMDNDVFQHVNNVNYFSYFDTAVTYYEMSENVVGLLDGPTHCVVAEVMCRYHSSLSFPDRVTVGVRVASIGRSSVRYDLAVFRNDEDIAAAEGHFVHVFVERGSQRPVAIPDEARGKLQRIAAASSAA
jgi:acyl-CoA thioester hydrolase